MKMVQKIVSLESEMGKAEWELAPASLRDFNIAQL
jgi:hypothetical protein